MSLLPNDLLFVQKTLSLIDGWLLEGSALFTLFLLRYQQVQSTKIEGPILEIGVFRGKYLSVMYQGALGTNSKVVGIDIFQWSTIEETQAFFKTAFTTYDKLKLIKGSSREYSSEQFIAECGGELPRFISVDGDHSGDGVFADMTLVSTMLQKRGIIAIDDFLNPSAIGVSEGAYRFFLSDGSLKPFAYCQNKLFVCHSSDHAEYLSASWNFVESNSELQMMESFNKNRKNGRHWVEQDLLGVKCLIL